MSPLKSLSVLLALFLVALPARAKTGPEIITIKNDKAAIGVSLSPEPRIVSYQLIGQQSLLLDDPGYERTGIRFVALEEKDGKQTGYNFGGQAKWIQKDESACTFESVLDEKGQVKLTVSLKLLPGSSTVIAACKLANQAEASRKLALWGIAAVPPKGWIFTTLARGIENNSWITGRLVKFFMSDNNDPVLKLGRDAMAFDLSLWHREGSPKFGTRSNEGWIAVARPDLNILLAVILPYDSKDRYPDDDCNVTMWFGTTPSKIPYAEAEWMSPWRDIASGEDLNWMFTLDLRPLPAMENGTPDSLVGAIRNPQVLAPKDTPETNGWRISVDGPLLKDSFQRVTEFRTTADGPVIAKAPIWFDAPIWSEKGITWLNDTLVEADAQTIPTWSGGRTWLADITFGWRGSLSTLATSILREGDEAAGFSLFLADGKAQAALWNGDQGCLVAAEFVSAQEKAHPMKSSSTDVKIRAQINAEKKILQIQVNDGPVEQVDIPFPLPTPVKRLALGRDSIQPKGLKLPALMRFSGNIRELSITP